MKRKGTYYARGYHIGDYSTDLGETHTRFGDPIKNPKFPKKKKHSSSHKPRPKSKGTIDMAARRKRAKRKSAAKKSRKGGVVPLKVLESRAAYLVELVQRRGGTVRRSTKLTHRRPKAAAKLAAKSRKRRSRRK